MTDSRPPLCGKCRMQLEFSADSEGQMIGSCLVCGQKDTVENIRRDVADYVAYFTEKATYDMLRNVVGQSSGKVRLVRTELRRLAFYQKRKKSTA